MSVRLVSGRLDSRAALRELESPQWGGVVLFEGRVRPDRNPQSVVVALDYEADRGLALRAMRTLAREAEERYGAARTVIWHRVGRVATGETAVIVGAAAEHRSAAFAAAKALINRVKREVPLWKTTRERPARRRPRPRGRRVGRSSGSSRAPRPRAGPRRAD